MKLGLDIDGIVANTSQAMINHANEKYNLNHTIEIFHDHNIFKDKYTDDDELNEEIAWSMVNDVIHSEDALLAVEPYEEAVEALMKLQRQHELHFITSRRESEQAITIKWMRDNHIPFTTVNCTGPSPEGGSSKGMLGRALNLDFYMDDQDKHLWGMYRFKARWRKPLALFTRPWNVWMPLDESRFVRVSNWEEVIRHLGIHKR